MRMKTGKERNIPIDSYSSLLIPIDPYSPYHIRNDVPWWLDRSLLREGRAGDTSISSADCASPQERRCLESQCRSTMKLHCCLISGTMTPGRVSYHDLLCFSP